MIIIQCYKKSQCVGTNKDVLKVKRVAKMM